MPRAAPFPPPLQPPKTLESWCREGTCSGQGGWCSCNSIEIFVRTTHQTLSRLKFNFQRLEGRHRSCVSNVDLFLSKPGFLFCFRGCWFFFSHVPSPFVSRGGENEKKMRNFFFADKASLMKKYNADKIIFLMSCSNKLTFFYIFFAESVDCSLLRLWLMYCHFHSSVKAMMEGAPPDADFILPASPHPRWKQMAAGLQHWHSYTTSWYPPGSAIFP